jgi:hypothetical protein
LAVGFLRLAFHRAVVAAALLLVSGAPSVGADWSVNPRVGVRALYDDNYRLTDAAGQEIDVTGGSLDARVGVRAESPRSWFEVTPQVKSTFFPDDPDEETDDQFVRLAAEYTGPRSVLGLNADYARVERLRTYLAAIDENAQLGRPETGEGITPITTKNREERMGIAPSLAYEFNPRYSFEFGAEWLDVSFDRQIENQNEDYSFVSASAGVGFRMSPTSTLWVRGNAGRYEPDGGDPTEGYGMVAEWSKRVSETSKAYARAGFNQVEVVPIDGDGTDAVWETGFSGGAGIQWDFEVTSIFVDATHNVDPTSTGQVVTRDQVQLRLQRRLRPTTSVFVGVRGVKDTGIVSDDDFVDREYATATVGFRWRMTQQFVLTGDYTFAWLKYQNRSSDAQSNAVSLGIVYDATWR